MTSSRIVVAFSSKVLPMEDKSSLPFMFLRLSTWTEWLTRRLLTTRVTSGSLVRSTVTHRKFHRQDRNENVAFTSFETLSNGSGRAFCNEICFNLLSKVISLPTPMQPPISPAQEGMAMGL